MSLTRLTDIQIQRLKSPEKGQKVYYESSGLGVRVSQGGTKSFVVQIGKSRKRHTIGRYPDVSLKEARGIAFRLLSEQHGNPVDIEFVDALKRYLASAAKRNSSRTVGDYKRLLTKHFPRGRLVEVSKSKLVQRLNALSDTPGEQSHATTSFKAFLNWCVHTGLLDANPIAGLRNQGRINRRDRVLSDAELKAIWNALGDDRFSRVVRLLILTGQRRGEVSHIKLDGDLAIIPSEFTKNRREHMFPVGPLTQEHFCQVEFNGWAKAKRRLDDVSGVNDWTLHDLRRTFASIHARLGTPIHVVEKLLNHVSGSFAGVAGIYNRYDYLAEMRSAVHAYEEWIRLHLLAG